MLETPALKHSKALGKEEVVENTDANKEQGMFSTKQCPFSIQKRGQRKVPASGLSFMWLRRIES